MPDRAARSMMKASIALIALVVSGGCHAPLDTSDLDDPSLAAIHTTFERVIENAHNDPEAQWHSGWMGNMQVNFWKGANYGLCHHWQDIVYAGVIETVERVGWNATGIRINNDTANEHHAVIVYDPDVLRREELLSPHAGDRAFVLDAWRRGHADVYRVTDWVDLPLVIHEAPELEPLPYRPPDGAPRPWLSRSYGE